MFWKSIVYNLRYNASIREDSALNSSRLEAYLRSALRNNFSPLILEDTDNIVVSNIRRLGGGLINDVYSFVLSYTEKGEEKQLHLVIKFYKINVDPIFEMYRHDRDLRMCVREYEVLRSLERVAFPVPKAYFCECNSCFLGYPFIIMAEVEKSQKNCEDYLDRFAVSLADLHNLEIDALKLNVLESPKDGCAFARRWPIHFKYALDIETKHSTRLKRDFDLALHWLELNASDNFCSRFSLIHGDAHPANAFLTKDLRITFIDWETVDIGDPAFDVGSAYNQIKFFSNPKDPDSSEHIADRFLSKYLQSFKGDIRSRLKFYQVVSLLTLAIPFSSVFSSPVKAYEYHRRKVLRSIPFLKLPLILLSFPFLRLPFVARQIGSDGELYWLRFFRNSIKKLI